MIGQNSKFKVQNSKFGWRNFVFFLLTAYCLPLTAYAQNFQKELKLKTGGTVEIINLFGRVRVEAVETEEGAEEKVTIIGQGSKLINDKDFAINNAGGKIRLEVNEPSIKRRIDLLVKVPERIKLKVETEEGEVAVDGDFASAEILTDTGTISTNIPLENLKYEFWWTQSRPRFLSDVQLEEVRERSAGRFVISGKLLDEEAIAQKKAEKEQATDSDSGDQNKENARNR
ncbi:MAG: hypothetical protein HC846_03190 [Blastocatellia bacterium]|nr:hypothetical protein [Blastocatellia bacterium]